MKKSGPVLLAILIFASSADAIYAQSGMGGGTGPGGGGGPGAPPGGGTGIFAVASPAAAGRTVTVGSRLVPVRKIVHNTSVPGYVDNVMVKVGDRVQRDQPLISLRRDAVGETFQPLLLQSRLKGVVSEIHVYETEEMKSGAPAVTILDDSSYLLKTSLSDRDAAAIKKLGNIPVIGRTPEGESCRGKIVSISQEPDYSTGLFTLTMEFPWSEGLFPGMVLFVDLAAKAAAGISVEKTALAEKEGKFWMWTLNAENLLTLREVVPGKKDGPMVEIKTGLSAGDRYISRLSGNEREGMSPRDLIQLNMDNTSEAGTN
jgi:multidrug efflux pump subunit AcrA (membrane-fusion protein)